jgi:hypothetical protein
MFDNMSTLRQLLLHRRSEVDRDMQKAMNAAAAPFLEEMREIDAALSAINTARSQVPPLEDQAALIEAEAPAEQQPSTPREKTRAIGLTLKEMILLTLRTRHRGADALTILDEINARWNIGLERTSLSPQLSRLKSEGKLHLIGKVWSLAQQDEAPDAETSGASKVGVAGSPGSPEQAVATGSTPVTSTTSLFPTRDDRKEGQ